MQNLTGMYILPDTPRGGRVIDPSSDLHKLVFGVGLEAAIPLLGQLVGHIDDTMSGFRAAVQNLAAQYG